MVALVDSYSENNQSSSFSLVQEGETNPDLVYQSFTGNGTLLQKATFYIKKESGSTGNINAVVYAHSGTFGTSSVPTGSVLATSEAVDASTIGTDYALQDFSFSGENIILLEDATKYIVGLIYDNGFPYSIQIGSDNVALNHAGNAGESFAGTPSAESGEDLCFYVYGMGETPEVGVVYPLPPFKKA